MNTVILGISSIIVHGGMIGKKIADFFDESHFEVKIKSPNLSQLNIAMLSIADLVQPAIRK